MSPVLRRVSRLLPSEVTSRLFARGALVSFVILASGAGLIFVAEVVLARLLGTGNYGLFSMVMAWLQVLTVVALAGSNNLLLRFVPVYVEAAEWPLLRGLMRYSVQVTLVIGATIFIIAVLSLVGQGESLTAETRWSFAIGMASVPVAALSLQRQSILRSLHRIGIALSPDYVVRPLLLMLLVVALAWGSGQVVTAPMALLINGMVLLMVFLLGYYWQRLAMPGETREAVPVLRAREWAGVALPLLLVACMQLLIARMDIMMLGMIMGREPAGAYAAASRIADLVVFGLGAANIVAAPMIAGLYARGDKIALQRLLRLVAGGMLLFTVPIVAILSGFGREILGLFGAGYQVAHMPLQLLVMGQLFNALCGPVAFLLSMTGNQIILMRILVIATALNMVLNILLIPHYGILGAAMATAATIVLWNVLMVLAVYRKIGVHSSVLVLLRARP